MAAAWKKSNLTTIRSHDQMRRSPVRYHRTNVPYDVLMSIYST
jgi:hypothetical protein